MTLLIIYFLAAVIISFVCSLLEATILSVSRPYIMVMQNRGHKSGKILMSLKNQIDRPLAAILTLNTVANTIGAAGVGAQVLKVYGNTYVALGSGILTLVILVCSEIIPKTLGAIHWKKLAPLAAYTIQWLIFLLYPLVVLLEYIGEWISNGRERIPRMTREEMVMSAEIGEDQGSLEKKEARIITNLLSLNKIFVKDIMTPRSVVVAISQDSTVDQVIEKYSPLPFSRIPVYAKDLDDVVGVVNRYDMLEIYGKDQGSMRLEDIVQPIHKVLENRSVTTVLDEFIRRKEHMFLATNKKGIITGIVTLEDTIETLLGAEIVDESDTVEDMRKFARDYWSKRKNNRRTSKVVRQILEELADRENHNEQENG